MMNKLTLVIGVSTNPNRYSNIAIQKLRNREIPTVAIGLKSGMIMDVSIDVEKLDYKNVDTITLYLNPKRQIDYYGYIINLKPRRVIFNPGTENKKFVKLLEDNNIMSEVACTLVLLSTNQY